MIVAVLCLASFSGCAALRRGPVPKDVAACRDLTQQGVTAMEMGYWTEAEELLEGAAERGLGPAAVPRSRNCAGGNEQKEHGPHLFRVRDLRLAAQAKQSYQQRYGRDLGAINP